MSNRRQRMTWAALNRSAAAAPAIPGYGVEDQEHPAHTQDDPGPHQYENGDTSSWNEDVRMPPYGDSGPPAIPGYGVEDQEHPAHQGQVGRKANVMALVRRKSAKAIVLAKATLGKKASWGQVEDQAFGYMTMDDQALDASIERLGGDFLGFEDELDDDMGLMDDDVLDMPPEVEDELEDPMEDRLMAMETEINALRAAAGKDDDDDEDKADKEAALPFMAMFDSYDSDNDGFVTAEDWGGPRALFASLDTDNDGIIARHEVMAGCDKLPEGKMRDNCENKGKDKETAKKDEDEDEDKGKKAFGHVSDFDDEELDMLQAMQFDMDDDMDLNDDILGCGTRSAKKKSDDNEKSDDDKGDDKGDDDAGDDKGDDDKGDDDKGDGDDGSDKEASGDAEFFAQGFDPMGLGGRTEITAADDAALRTVFGGGDEDKDEDKGKDKEASLSAILNPQPRKASKGVQSVGRVSKSASSKGGEIADLSKLWASDPDVSGSY